MTIIDSSGWVEMFRGGKRAKEFRRHLDRAEGILVPAVVIFEVHRVIARLYSVADADRVVGYLQSFPVVTLDGAAAARAARLIAQHSLALADALIYSCAVDHGAHLVTGDVDFKGLPDVHFIPVEK